MDNKEKNNLFLLTIVAIVAIVAIVIMIATSGSSNYGFTSGTSEDYVGQAVRVAADSSSAEDKITSSSATKTTNIG